MPSLHNSVRNQIHFDIASSFLLAHWMTLRKEKIPCNEMSMLEDLTLWNQVEKPVERSFNSSVTLLFRRSDCLCANRICFAYLPGLLISCPHLNKNKWPPIRQYLTIVNETYKTPYAIWPPICQYTLFILSVPQGTYNGDA